MKKLILLSFLVSILFSGCSMILQHSENELQDLEKTRKVAQNYLIIAPMQIGFIKGALDMEELPMETIIAIQSLEDLTVDPNCMNDDACLGYSLGLRTRITSDLIKETIKRHAPELLRYWP